ncbi:MAG: polyprenol monophosphomannose synthase [Pseudomonadales bacterium]
MNLSLSIVIPTYNEAENIGKLLQCLHDGLSNQVVAYEVIVVDDASSDGTVSVVQTAVKDMPVIRLLQRKAMRDLSSAIAAGFDEAQGEYLLVMDADFQHPPAMVSHLLHAAQQQPVDLVIATRYAEGGGAVQAWNRGRYALSRFATFMVRGGLPNKVSDPLSGFFLMRKTAWLDIRAQLQPQGFKLLLDILMAKPSLRCTECGYIFAARKHGRSKLSGKVGVAFLRALWRLWRRSP